MYVTFRNANLWCVAAVMSKSTDAEKKFFTSGQMHDFQSPPTHIHACTHKCNDMGDAHVLYTKKFGMKIIILLRIFRG